MKIHLLSIVLAAAVAFDAHADGIQVLNADAHFAEGPIWYHGKLYYVEYDRNSVTTWDGAEEHDILVAEGMRAISSHSHGSGRVSHHLLRQRNASAGYPPTDERSPPIRRTRTATNLWARTTLPRTTTAGFTSPPRGIRVAVIDGKVFYLAADGTIEQKASNVHSANGVAVSKDGKILYVVETEGHRLLQFNIGAGRRHCPIGACL